MLEVKKIDGISMDDLLSSGWTIDQIKADPKWKDLLEESKTQIDCTSDCISDSNIDDNSTDQEIEKVVDDCSVKCEDVVQLEEKFNIEYESLKEDHNEISPINNDDIPEDLVCDTEQFPIFISLTSNSIQIDYIVNTTGQTEKVVASNRSIRMMSGRSYLVPVSNKSINSDTRNIKIFSDVAGLINVLYVKNGLAYITPLLRNVTLNDGQRICVLSKVMYE